MCGCHPARRASGSNHVLLAYRTTFPSASANVSEDPDLLLRQIGLRVLQRRQDLDLSQRALAEKLGMQHANVARIEYGQQNLTVRTLTKVADAFGVTVLELLGGVPAANTDAQG